VVGEVWVDRAGCGRLGFCPGAMLFGGWMPERQLVGVGRLREVLSVVGRRVGGWGRWRRVWGGSGLCGLRVELFWVSEIALDKSIRMVYGRRCESWGAEALRQGRWRMAAG